MIVVLFILLVLMDYEMEHQKVVGVKQKIESLSIIIGTVCQELIFIGFLDVWKNDAIHLNIQAIKIMEAGE